MDPEIIQDKLDKENPRLKKPKIKGVGFSHQKKAVEENKYYLNKKKKK